MRGLIVRCAAVSAALLVVAASPPPTKLENLRQHVPLTREQVVSIWRAGDFVFCLSQGYDIGRFANCEEMMGILLIKEMEPQFDLTKAHLPADMLENLGDGHCRDGTWKDRFACAGFAEVFRTAPYQKNVPAEQSAFSRQVLEWIAPETLGAEVNESRVLDEMLPAGKSQPGSEGGKR